MAEFISVETDFEDTLNFLKGLDKEYPKIRRRMLTGIGSTAANKSKQAYRGLLQKRTGSLYRSIKRSVVKSGKAVVIYPRAKSSNGVAYGFPLAKGSTIEAKKEDYLTFQVNGRWVKKKQVKVQSHDFVEGPVMKFVDSKDYRDRMDKLLAKEIAKLEKKGYVIVPSTSIGDEV